MRQELLEGLFTGVVFVLFVGSWGVLLYRMWIRHALQHATAKHELPRLAARMGLYHMGSKDPKKIGALSGRLRGYEVKVDPDANESTAKLVVKLRKEHSLTLTRLRWGDLSGFGRVTFPRKRLNRYFKTRRASRGLAAYLGEERPAPPPGAGEPRMAGYRDADPPAEGAGPDVVAALDGFVARWGKHLVVCELNNDELGCSPVVGTGENAAQSVSATQVSSILPDMVAVAEVLDALPEPLAKLRD